MSICDNCIHDEVCGLEDNHEEAITFCADMIPKDMLDKIRAEIDKELLTYSQEVENMGDSAQKIRISLGIVRKIIDKYREESE